MINMPVSAIRVAAFCLPLALITSCGSGSEAVQGTVIVISPAAIAQNVPSNGTSSITQEKFTISLKSPTGYPQVGIKVVIDTPGTLYLVDTSTTPYTYTLVPSSYTGTISSANDVITVAVSYTSSTGADGDVTVISAFSGTAYNRTNITYTCVDNPLGPAPNTCP